MNWGNTPTPYYYLIGGVISLLVAVVSTCTGKIYGRYGGWASRAKDSTEFWWTVAVAYVGGVCFVGYSLYKLYGLN
jgi:hypothetical protein